MAIKQNNAEGGTNTTTVTTGNSGSGSGDAFSAVTTSGSPTFTFSTSNRSHGSLSYSITGISGDTAYAVLTNTSGVDGSVRLYVCLTSLPSAAQSLLLFRNAAVADGPSVGIDATNKLTVSDATGSLLYTAPSALVAGTWYRLELQTNAGTTSTNGTIFFQYYTDDNIVLQGSYAARNVNAGSSPLTSVSFGKLTSLVALSAYFDDIAYDNTSLAPVGPFVATIRKNTAEGQTDGTTLTAGNSGSGSGNAFSSVTVTGTIPHTFSTQLARNGTQSYKVVPSASSALYILYDTTAQMAGASQAYYYFTGYPSVNQSLLKFQSTSDTQVCDLNLVENGALRIYNSTGIFGQAVTSSAGIVPLNTWVRLDLQTYIGTTTGNGRIQTSMTVGNNSSPSWTYDSGYTANAGTTTIESFRFGKQDDVPTIATFYMDDLTASFGTMSFIPPTPMTASFPWLGV